MGIGTKQMYNDLGVDVKIQILMDANAGISMMKKQGLGSVKHVATQYLWVQENVYNKDVELLKVGTTEKNADLMTKSLAEASMSRVLLQSPSHQR